MEDRRGSGGGEARGAQRGGQVAVVGGEVTWRRGDVEARGQRREGESAWRRRGGRRLGSWMGTVRGRSRLRVRH
jgi:hypothetical protein